MPSPKKLAGLERAFAGPYAAYQNRLQELTRVCDFLSAYLRAHGYQETSLAGGGEDLDRRSQLRRVLDGLRDDPGIQEAREHLPNTPAAWQAFNANPEEYLRACVERLPKGASR